MIRIYRRKFFQIFVGMILGMSLIYSWNVFVPIAYEFNDKNWRIDSQGIYGEILNFKINKSCIFIRGSAQGIVEKNGISKKVPFEFLRPGTIKESLIDFVISYMYWDYKEPVLPTDKINVVATFDYECSGAIYKNVVGPFKVQ